MRSLPKDWHIHSLAVPCEWCRARVGEPCDADGAYVELGSEPRVRPKQRPHFNRGEAWEKAGEPVFQIPEDTETIWDE